MFGTMLARFFASLVKLVVASLAIGAGLSASGISMQNLLGHVGMTPDDAAAMIVRGVTWALPNVVLGSVFVIPAWLLMNLLRPPRGYD